MSKSSSKPQQKPTWGRAYGEEAGKLGATVVFLFSPLLPLYYHIACKSKYQCELSAPLVEIWNGRSVIDFFLQESPRPTWHAFQIFFLWEILHVLLYLYLPGPTGWGQETPAGFKLRYNVNGLRVWFITHVLFIGGSFLGLFPATIVYDNWGPLLIIANVFGYLLATFAYVKALVAPSHRNDVKFSGSFIYDFFFGTEFNPRIGDFDFKLFFNGRPGIGGWNIFNLSFIAAQYQIHGRITNSIVLVTLLHLTYIIDFFWNEDWYLRTIDIAHDHFGWYLAWGDSVWLPWMYTLQGFYLVHQPYDLTNTELAFVIGLGIFGYAVFRLVNDQKNAFRKNPSKCIIWGKKATYIEAPYSTTDGKTRTGYLLTSGFWGLSRHFNYLGDLALSLAFCAACGFNNIYPYFYIIYMTILLVHRVERDHSRCKAKYGANWTKYTKQVPWKIVPYIY